MGIRNLAAAVAISPTRACVGVNGCNWASASARHRQVTPLATACSQNQPR